MTAVILYIEDDAEEVILMNYFFKKYATDAEILIFKNGIEFFNFLQQKSQDKDLNQGHYCILLDINLPYLNGFEILKKIKTSTNKQIRAIPVVMFSSSHREIDKQRSLELGATLYLQKPMSYEDMKKVLETLIANVISYQE